MERGGEKCENESHSRTQRRADQEKITRGIRRLSEAYLYLLKMVLSKERDTESENTERLFFLKVPATTSVTGSAVTDYGRSKGKQHNHMFFLFISYLYIYLF